MQTSDYEIQILIQLLMLFAVLSMIVVPAIIFRDVALRSNKRGWLYFLIGLGVGLLAFAFGSLTARLLKYFEIVPRANGDQGRECAARDE